MTGVHALAPFSFDITGADWVVEHRAEPWTSLWQMVTVLGDTVTLTLVVIGVFVLAWMAGRIDLSALIVLGSVFGYALMVILKHTFGRQRPPVADRLIDVGGLSFPSGHAMLTTVVLGLTTVVCYRIYPWMRAHPIMLLVAPAVTVAVGLSRVYLGVHWFSDVLIGWTIGVAWLLLCLLAHAQIMRRISLRGIGTRTRVRVESTD